MDWSSYLAFGTGSCDECFSEPLSSGRIVRRLQKHGYFVFNFESDTGKDELKNWESVFRRTFAQDNKTKLKMGKYRLVDDLAVGYRKDESREFLETRLVSSEYDEAGSNKNISRWNGVEPNISNFLTHRDTILSLTNILADIGSSCLRMVAIELGLHEDSFVSLTDLDCPKSSDIKLSSSLIRICSYPPGAHTSNSGDKTVAFGNHTDTSLITVAPCSGVPGLEILDQWSKKWVKPEVGKSSSCVIVFTGELLQMLTNHHFRAAVHRVRSPAEGERTRVR